MANANGRRATAATPPMGWNSYDCFGTRVTEDEVKANARYMAEHLLQHGWEYVVVDMGWYIPDYDNDVNWGPASRMEMDEFGRLWPALNLFPSSAGGNGFKPLADYVHSLGLKFGVHIMRGLTTQAVEENARVLGTSLHAADIVDMDGKCDWCSYTRGVKPSAEGAQAWYDSVFELLASWGVDFVKTDDISSPYHRGEIELASKAVSRCGREMVLSLSPGPAPFEEAEHLAAHADMWRISADFWDRWEDLSKAFELAERWEGFAREGAWPDLDMLPFGRIAIRQHPLNLPDRRSRFTEDEQETLMSLWCLLRSPMMLGGHLPDNSEHDLALITNDEVLSLLKNSRCSRQIYRTESQVAWAADGEHGSHYLALFNLGSSRATISVQLETVFGEGHHYAVRDLWCHSDLGPTEAVFATDVAGHGARLFAITAEAR